jgi:hypothetical protein
MFCEVEMTSSTVLNNQSLTDYSPPLTLKSVAAQPQARSVRLCLFNTVPVHLAEHDST